MVMSPPVRLNLGSRRTRVLESGLRSKLAFLGEPRKVLMIRAPLLLKIEYAVQTSLLLVVMCVVVLPSTASRSPGSLIAILPLARCYGTLGR